MRKIDVRVLLFLFIWILSISTLLWCQWPIKTIVREIDFQPGKVIISPENNLSAVGKPISFPEERKLILEYSPIIRKGDRSEVKLGFIRSTSSTPTNNDLSSFEENYISVYDVYSVTAESRIELNGVEVDPGGISGQVLPPGQDIQFMWTLKPGSSGVFEGITWLYLKLYPLDGRSPLVEQAISAQTLDIKIISLLGLNSNFWRFFGVIGLGIGIIVLKIENIRSFISSARRKPR